MNILYLDIDSLRPDHLGCYGYHRRTSSHIDAVAAEGLRFRRCYTPDAPCLPSRTAMTTGMFGIRSGVVNHGGARSVMFPFGRKRGFSDNWTNANWASQLKANGYHTVAFSPFAERHGAWHWYAGFMEMHNTGGGGNETADQISPQVTDWLDRRGRDNSRPFFLWVNLWDPHTPYRTPMEFENPFANDPLPAWYTEDVRAEHWEKAGPHSAREVNGWEPSPEWMFGPGRLGAHHPTMAGLQPREISDLGEARRMFDGYDMGVAYADHHIGLIIQKLKDLGIYDTTAIILSSDHGENLGELWVYGDHQTADHFTHHVPMIVRWPGVTDAVAGACDDRLLYSFDIAATTIELTGRADLRRWDGISIAGDLRSGTLNRAHRDSLVLSQLAWCAQRAARWDNYLCIRTYHDGFHDYPEWMVFDLATDLHEQNDLAGSRPDLLETGRRILDDWKRANLERSHTGEDPLDTVLSEGGPFHVRGEGWNYLPRLRSTGRADIAQRLAIKHHLPPANTET